MVILEVFGSVGSNSLDWASQVQFSFRPTFSLRKSTYFSRTLQSYFLELKSISAPDSVRKAKNKMFSDVRVRHGHDDTSHGSRLTVIRSSALFLSGESRNFLPNETSQS